MAFTDLMATILPGSPAGPDSGFFRSNGSVHGAVDFNYIDGNLNAFGGPQVFAPISGLVVSVDPGR